MSKLKPCPCGETPEYLTINHSGQGNKWAEASHCDWAIEFRTQYFLIGTNECRQLAEEAWNEAPRKEQSHE